MAKWRRNDRKLVKERTMGDDKKKAEEEAKRKAEEEAKKRADKDNKNDPSMYQDPMRNIAAGGTGNVEDDEDDEDDAEPKRKG